MKQAYISIVVHSRDITDHQAITNLSRVLTETSKLSEVIIVSHYGTDHKKLCLHNENIPITVVYTKAHASADEMYLAGLARAAGDYVVLWTESIERFTLDISKKLLAPASNSFEITQISSKLSASSYAFLSLLNTTRRNKKNINPAVAYCFSRHALNILIRETRFESDIDIAVANIPFEIFCYDREIDTSARKMSFMRKVTLILKGTNIGLRAPMILSILSGFISFLIVIYALGVYLLNGKSPEGWTTLMIAVGVSQSSVLAVLTFILGKVAGIESAINRSNDVTSNVDVFANGKIRNLSD